MTGRRDTRTELDVSLQAIGHRLKLADDKLCAADIHTAPLPGHAQGKRCTREEINEHGHVVACAESGTWGQKTRGIPVRRLCTHHAAEVIRARLWLQQLRLQRGLTNV